LEEGKGKETEKAGAGLTREKRKFHTSNVID